MLNGLLPNWYAYVASSGRECNIERSQSGATKRRTPTFQGARVQLDS